MLSREVRGMRRAHGTNPTERVRERCHSVRGPHGVSPEFHPRCLRLPLRGKKERFSEATSRKHSREENLAHEIGQEKGKRKDKKNSERNWNSVTKRDKLVVGVPSPSSPALARRKRSELRFLLEPATTRLERPSRSAAERFCFKCPQPNDVRGLSLADSLFPHLFSTVRAFPLKLFSSAVTVARACGKLSLFSPGVFGYCLFRKASA